MDLTATFDGESAYKDADFVIIAAPTNYDSKLNFFDCSAVEAVIELVLRVNPEAHMQHIDLKGKTILVTGSAGFIGSNLAFGRD